MACSLLGVIPVSLLVDVCPPLFPFHCWPYPHVQAA